MMGINFIRMTFKERVIVISVLSGILLITVVVDKIYKIMRNKNQND